MAVFWTPRSRASLRVLALALSACGEKPLTTAPSAISPPPATVAPSAPPPQTAADASVGSSTTDAASAPLPPPSASVAVAVAVSNIGLHIGGGPNDAITKEPVLKSVEPHFEAFRACFAAAEDPKKGGDFGVDLLIEPAGGVAKVTHPRTIIAGEAFRACVVGVFEKVEFRKPRGGRTMASYSLHFTPR